MQSISNWDGENLNNISHIVGEKIDILEEGPYTINK